MGSPKLLSPKISIHFMGWGVIGLLMFIGFAGSSYWDLRVARSHRTQLEGILKQVRHMDQLLDSYVRSAATVGDAELESFYLEAVVQRDTLMTQLKDYFPAVFELREVADMIAMKEAMAGLESQVFEFVRGNKLELVEPLVFDGTYERQSESYSAGFSGLESALQNEADADSIMKQNKFFWILTGGIGLIPLAVFWYFLWIKKLYLFYDKYGRAISVKK